MSVVVTPENQEVAVSEVTPHVVTKEPGSPDVITVSAPGPQGPPGTGGSGGVTSVNTRTGAVTLAKDDVGLANVDNTSDAGKPVSTAQQSALNLKQDAATAATDAELGTERARIDAVTAAQGGRQMSMITPWSIGSHQTFTLNSARAYFARFVPMRNITVSGIAFHVTTAATVDDPVDVGIYNGSTGARVASSGGVTGHLNAVGRKEVPLSASLTAGTVYYVALVYSVGGTGAALRSATLSTEIASLPGTSSPNVEAGVQNSAYPLPSSVVSISGPQAVQPVVAVLGT